MHEIEAYKAATKPPVQGMTPLAEFKCGLLFLRAFVASRSSFLC
jgi:hypothetical protein